MLRNLVPLRMSVGKWRYGNEYRKEDGISILKEGILSVSGGEGGNLSGLRTVN